MDSYTAYDKFLKGNFENLIGTQRDVFRVTNRQQKGLLTDYNIFPLGGYTDLVQYISVFEKEKTNPWFVTIRYVKKTVGLCY